MRNREKSQNLISIRINKTIPITPLDQIDITCPRCGKIDTLSRKDCEKRFTINEHEIGIIVECNPKCLDTNEKSREIERKAFEESGGASLFPIIPKDE